MRAQSSRVRSGSICGPRWVAASVVPSVSRPQPSGVLDLLRRMLFEEGLEEPDQERPIGLGVTLPGLAIEVVDGGQRIGRDVAGGEDLLREVVGLSSLGREQGPARHEDRSLHPMGLLRREEEGPLASARHRDEDGPRRCRSHRGRHRCRRRSPPRSRATRPPAGPTGRCRGDRRRSRAPASRSTGICAFHSRECTMAQGGTKTRVRSPSPYTS